MEHPPDLDVHARERLAGSLLGESTHADDPFRFEDRHEPPDMPIADPEEGVASATGSLSGVRFLPPSSRKASGQ